jgi:hypothetical protein
MGNVMNYKATKLNQQTKHRLDLAYEVSDEALEKRGNGEWNDEKSHTYFLLNSLDLPNVTPVQMKPSTASGP